MNFIMEILTMHVLHSHNNSSFQLSYDMTTLILFYFYSIFLKVWNHTINHILLVSHENVYFLTGLPARHFSYVRNITPGLPLFLFNYSDRKLHGIFEATSKGKMCIDPFAWTNDFSEMTPYPAQVPIPLLFMC